MAVTTAPPQILLDTLRFEATIVAIAASDIADAKPLDADDAMRLAVAAGRLTRIIEMLERPR